MDPSCASVYRCYCWLFPFRALASRSPVPTAPGGFLLPADGPDHLLMPAAGVLSALQAVANLLPFATLGMMLVGALWQPVLGSFSGMEMLIIASLPAVSGVMIFDTENRLLLAVYSATAMFHGWAHGVEMSGQLLAFTQRLYRSPAPRCAPPALRGRAAAAPSRRPA